MQILAKNMRTFQLFIWDFYRENKRSFAWRNIDDPYKVVVSEIMLQQTQTYRVEPKFDSFVAAFPNFESLACASLRDVLSLWQGLGYNRRGKFLHEIAKKVINEYGGFLPDDPVLLEMFPGIGPGTAGSICAFAFNKPTVFIETNIRTVFIHSFFSDRHAVHDRDLMPLISQTLDHNNPREWYYALMDYGVYLKKQLPNPSRKSAHHIKQSKFEGSNRQVRGAIIKLLTEHRSLKEAEIVALVTDKKGRVQVVIEQLCREKFINKSDLGFSIIEK